MNSVNRDISFYNAENSAFSIPDMMGNGNSEFGNIAMKDSVF